jgi:hypothetical protein
MILAVPAADTAQDLPRLYQRIFELQSDYWEPRYAPIEWSGSGRLHFRLDPLAITAPATDDGAER